MLCWLQLLLATFPDAAQSLGARFSMGDRTGCDYACFCMFLLITAQIKREEHSPTPLNDEIVVVSGSNM